MKVQEAHGGEKCPGDEEESCNEGTCWIGPTAAGNKASRSQDGTEIQLNH